MKTEKIGAGTPFLITIPLPEAIENYENVLAALYTDKNKSVKFSYVEQTGYNKINVGLSTFELETILTGEQTAKMDGCLFMEMKFIKDGQPINKGNSLPTPVLNELGYQAEFIPTVLS